MLCVGRDEIFDVMKVCTHTNKIEENEYWAYRCGSKATLKNVKTV